MDFIDAKRAADAARQREALRRNPADRIAWHNLAAAEGDLGNAGQAEHAARQAIALGLGAPETRLVLARALMELNRLDEAERVFEEALALRPNYAQAHRDLAQLRWMRGGSVRDALRALDRALQATHDPALALVRSIALEFMGEAEGALASVEAALEAQASNPTLLRQAAHLSAQLGGSDRAVHYAERAAQLTPQDTAAQITLCEALLAAGAAARAEGVAAELCARLPADQHALALRATAWRLLGDPRHAALNDYASLVHAQPIPTPPGWQSLAAFLADVAGELHVLHRFASHPFQQSVRGGGQLTLHGTTLQRPPLAALFTAFSSVIREHLERLGAGADPVRARNSGRFAIAGAWSVRLASGGYHTGHVHQRGWLSSAFYVSLPRVIGDADHAGWLRFGKPGIATQPELAPEHWVKPEAGKLVLFPSYTWHGVEPFESAEPRLTVAFDVVPA